MKSIVCLIAIIAQLLCGIVAAAKYGLGAGVIVLCAILLNAIQVVTKPKE